MDELSPVSQLLKKARRRSLLDLVLDQAALAITIAMGGAIVLMLLGTSLLEWYWIALLAIASLAVGLYRFRGRVPSEYRLAQRIDWNLNLADALSTATYFAGVPESSERREEICAQQRYAAEQIARTIDPKAAVPITRSRFALPAAGLLLVACGLFAFRYAVTGTMSMEPSLVKMAYDTFFGTTPQKQLAKNPPRKSPLDPNSPVDPSNPDAPTTQNDKMPDSQMESVETPDVNNPGAPDQSKEAAKGQKTSPEDSKGEDGEKGEKGEQSANQDEGNQDKKDSAKSDKGGDKKEGKQDAKNQNASNENSSMLDKLKDAMANMMNKMKSSPPKESQSAQNSQDSKSGGQEKGQKSAQNQKGSQSDSQDADAQSDQQQQQSDKSEQKQSANAKSGDKSQDKNNSPDAKSGIGSSDGDKAAKEAEQLKAMGKISEILGKRAANVTGEVMVEVGSTKQQLKTPWAQKQATHVEAGSEIHRDEVPLMYQQFVQQYFEEIRKGTDGAAKPGTAKPADSKATPKTPSP